MWVGGGAGGNVVRQSGAWSDRRKKGGQGMRMAQRLSIWGVLVVGSWGVVGLVVVGLRWLLRGAW